MQLIRPSALLAFVLVCALSLIAIPFAHAQACPKDGSFSHSITGTGASTLGPFLAPLVLAYRDLSKTTCPSYVTSSSGFGRAAIISKTVPLLIRPRKQLVVDSESDSLYIYIVFHP